MAYKVCENCGAKLHERTQKCPECSFLLTKDSKVVEEEPLEKENTDTKPSIDDIQSEDKVEAENNRIIEDNAENAKDYVYKAEVRHSIEYTSPLSNLLKVIITTFATIPFIGQIIGSFFGIFFMTYEDNDRKSFGRALIGLSIVMFLFYAYIMTIYTKMLQNVDINGLINSIK